MAELNEIRQLVHVICTTGAPGAGKEKKGVILQHVFSCPKFTMSDRIRARRQGSDAVAKQLVGSDKIQESGDLVDAVPVGQIFIDDVCNAYDNGICVSMSDGFPRNAKQAKRLLLSGIIFTLIHFKIDKDTCLARVRRRAETEGPRDDDAEVAKRFKVYEDETLPAIALIKRTNRLAVLEIDATLPVREQIVKVLRKVCTRNQTAKKLAFQKLVDHIDDPRTIAHQLMGDLQSGKKTLHHPALRDAHPHVQNTLGVSAREYA